MCLTTKQQRFLLPTGVQPGAPKTNPGSIPVSGTQPGNRERPFTGAEAARGAGNAGGEDEGGHRC